MSITARRDNIAILPDPLPTTEKGIILPQSANPNYRTGEVKSVGPEVEWDEIKEGKKVLYIQRNAVEVDGLQLVTPDKLDGTVGKNIIFSSERINEQNKIQVTLVKV